MKTTEHDVISPT